jgi:hypothetical protein
MLARVDTRRIDVPIVVVLRHWEQSIDVVHLCWGYGSSFRPRLRSERERERESERERARERAAKF